VGFGGTGGISLYDDCLFGVGGIALFGTGGSSFGKDSFLGGLDFSLNMSMCGNDVCSREKAMDLSSFSEFLRG